MCFYEHHKFVCGCQEWGKLLSYCKEREECEKKMIGKHVYDRSQRFRQHNGYSCPSSRRLDLQQRVEQRIASRQIRTTHKPLIANGCKEPTCTLDQGHLRAQIPCQRLVKCSETLCFRYSGHPGEHRGSQPTLKERILKEKRDAILADETALDFLVSLVLQSMIERHLRSLTQRIPNQQRRNTLPIRHADRRNGSPAPEVGKQRSSIYPMLNLSKGSIRLFELCPRKDKSEVVGQFHQADLSDPPNYVALSYTWGLNISTQKIRLNDGETMAVGQNLWNFLHNYSATLSEPVLLWIDAICIDQADVHERNHQVGLMQRIYTNAGQVVVWIGKQADKSDLAMDFLLQQDSKGLRKRGQRYLPIWTREVGSALAALCERTYWKRMWIIQEILHAKSITVWCGAKSCSWSCFGTMYLKVRTLDDAHWSAHEPFVLRVIQSALGMMVWQRAHFRHLDTPRPQLRTLIQIFRDWQCTDVRDKVFALVGMAAAAGNIVPDYSLTAREVYFAVLATLDEDSVDFLNLLSQLLGLSHQDVGQEHRDLIEYKVQPAERLVLKARLQNDWSPITRKA